MSADCTEEEYFLIGMLALKPEEAMVILRNLPEGKRKAYIALEKKYQQIKLWKDPK